MSVIVKYIVVRDGVEKMTFTTKKEADAYDKMLDIAYNLVEFINESADVKIDEKKLEDLSFFMAQNKDKAISILKGSKPASPKPELVEPAESKPAESKPAESKSGKGKKATSKPAVAKSRMRKAS